MIILANFEVSKEKPFYIENQHGFCAEKDCVRQNSVLQENRVNRGVPVYNKSIDLMMKEH